MNRINSNASDPTTTLAHSPALSFLLGFALRPAARIAGGLILLLAAGLWLIFVAPPSASHSASSPFDIPSTDPPTDASVVVGTIPPGTIAAMHSPGITYSPGWRVDGTGADPMEPDDPWNKPAGALEFTYTGQSLALLLAEGNYWGYLYVTVDGEPANRLAHVPGNFDSQGTNAGYTTLYAPERSGYGPPVPRWVPIHEQTGHASGEENTEPIEHSVRVEMWRSWGQVPIRAIAVDALLPPPRPTWPSVLFALMGLALLGGAGFQAIRAPSQARLARLRNTSTVEQMPRASRALQFSATHAGALASGGVAILGVALFLHGWWLAWVGLLLLAIAAIHRPAYWLGALGFGLPFYYSVTLPLLPARAFSLIDAGVLLGFGVLAGHLLLRCLHTENTAPAPQATNRLARLHSLLLWTLIGWALVSAAAAYQWPQALHEWRTVFLMGGLFWLLLRLGLDTPAPGSGVNRSLGITLGGWLAGGAVVAIIAIAQYLGDVMLITAEGVARVRGLYGSPNNLALYLERTLMVSVGLALYLPTATDKRLRGALWLATPLQLVALVLTFSKGALLLALPGGFAVLFVAGLVLLPRQGRSYFPLWQLLGLVALTLAILLPFLGTERFSNLLDVSQGTGFFRVNLWQSAWAMSLDHWLLGVGPDNFLYAFRSHYILPAAWQDPNLNHPHNLLLDGWTRLGLPGLILLLAYFGLGIVRLWRGLDTVRLWRGLRKAKPAAERAEPALVAGLLAAVVAGLAHGLIDVSYALPDLMLVWVLLFHLWRGSGQVNQHAVDADIVQEGSARQTQ